MPAANVEITADNRSWWDKLVDGFRWIGDKLSKLFNALAKLVVNILPILLILAVVVIVVFAVGFPVGIPVAIVAVAALAVIAVIYGLTTRLDEYRLYRGEPDNNTYLQMGLISLGSLIGVPQLMESWQVKRLLTELPLTEQERWDYGVEGVFQVF